MTDTAACERLNDLLIELGRSLLQYACEAWPWAAGAEGERLQATVRRLGSQQREAVATLADLLDQEGHAVDFGVYPPQYTSLHYVSLEYLLDRLIAGQQAIAADCAAAAGDMPADSPAAELTRGIADRETASVRELTALRASLPGA